MIKLCEPSADVSSWKFQTTAASVSVELNTKLLSNKLAMLSDAALPFNAIELTSTVSSPEALSPWENHVIIGESSKTALT
jgi:hypothetical protein